MLFPLTGSHCPHGKVRVPDTELNSRYLSWEPEFHEFFHLGDSPRQGPAGKPIFLKKGAWERRKSATTQPGGYSQYASLDCRAELQHTALSGIDLSMFFSGSQLEWQAHGFKKERIHFGTMHVALSCPMKSPSAMPERSCHRRAVAGEMAREAMLKSRLGALLINRKVISQKPWTSFQAPKPSFRSEVELTTFQSEVSWQAGTKPDYNSALSGSSTDRGAL